MLVQSCWYQCELVIAAVRELMCVPVLVARIKRH